MNILNLFQPHRKPLQTMSAAKLWELLKRDPHSVRIVDLRDPATYANGHIPHAVNQPTFHRGFCASLSLPEGLYNRPIVFYSSHELTAEELEAGSDAYPKRSVYALDGGWLSWIRAGYPITPLGGSLLEPGQFIDGMDERLTR